MTPLEHYAELQSQLGGITEALVENGLMKRNLNTSVDYLIEVAKNHDHFTKLLTDLRTQRDALYERLLDATTCRKYDTPTLEELVERVIGELKQTRLAASESNQELLDLFTDEVCDALGLENGFTPEHFHAALGVSKPTHDNRYIVHGDIQPCVVLYSDETTTLVRLDENDMMCETDTIEWSDELTYRCQEMLRTVTPEYQPHYAHIFAPLLAHLARDERILLNDDADSCEPTTPKTCLVCAHVTDGTLDLCPQCHTPFGGLDNA